MVAEPVQRERDRLPRRRRSAKALADIVEIGRAVAESPTFSDALTALVERAAAACGADVVLARVRRADRALIARAVSGPAALVAELEGTRLDAAALPPDDVSAVDALPPAVAAAARRAGAAAVLLLPVRSDGEPVATLELFRSGARFDDEERLAAEAAVAHLALAVRAFEPRPDRATVDRGRAVELLGEALAAGEDANEGGARLARIAALATGATAALLWLADDDRGPVWVASHGSAEPSPELEEVAVEVLTGRTTVRLEQPAAGGDSLATIRLGEPPLGALQLVFSEHTVPDETELAGLATFGVRAAQSLRESEHARAVGVELERTRALLGVLGQAIAQLSLTHTVETVAARVAELLAIERVAVYIREEHGLETAAESGLDGPHVVVAQRLLELALGPYRARGVLAIADVGRERRLAPVADALVEAAIESVVAVPLHGQDEVVGLLVAYPPRGRVVLPGETSLLTALGAQLAVAVQNARLHEQTKRLGSELESALVAERRAARQLRALYEISGSFVEHLSLLSTLEAVATTVVESFDLDAAAIRMLDRRRGELVTRAVHVAGRAPVEPLRALLSRPQPIDAAAAALSPAAAEPTLLDVESASRLGGAHELLGPFLVKGSTVAVVPISTKTELLATLTLLSLDPARPITRQSAQATRSVAAQAALAIDNARLYEQQKDFADTMQRSLLPSTEPTLDGFELGHVYESSARVDVGGDIYDFVFLADGRLAVVLGDVTGHGIDATADMAMAKFVFRSLVREHPEPAAFLARANEVLVGEIEVGRFITMTYVLLDVERSEVVSASAGHPPPRLVTPAGRVLPITSTGLALGIERGQTYDETTTSIEPGGSVVLYTDGVVEVRQNGDLYGTERLDALLASSRRRSARELARAVVDDCRAFGGELVDDCAVVIVKRTP